MKTSEKICIITGTFLLCMVLGYIVYDITYLKKTTPKTHHVNSLIDTKDEVSIAINWSYSAILEDDSCKDKEMWIKLLYTEVTHEILWDFYLEDYLQKKDEILCDINKALTTKVVQKFPDIEFQIIDIEMIIEL